MRAGNAETEAAGWLVCRVAGCLCALPVESVSEVMRPRPVEPISGVPQFLLGLSIIRGSPVPVVDAALLLSGNPARAGHLVTMAVGGRTIGLAVEHVVDVWPIDPAALDPLPPLLQNIACDVIAAIRALDGELLLLLDAARIIPDTLYAELSAAGAPA